MSNVSYYFALPEIGIRKGIVEAHAELHKANKVLYEQIPYRISLYKSFKHRKNIQFFLNHVAFKMETFTEIERLKILEAKYHQDTLLNTFNVYTKAAVLIFGFSKVFHINKE